MTKRRLRFGLIGLGNFGPQMAKYINEVAEVVAICDQNPQSLAQFAEQGGGVTVLDRDILTIPMEEIPGALVDYTIVNGEVRYRRD